MINRSPFKTLAEHFLKHLRNLVCFARNKLTNLRETNLTAQMTFNF